MPVNEGKWSRGAAIGLLFYDFCELPRAIHRPLLTPLRVTVISIDLEVSTRPVSPASCPKREKVDLVWTMSKKNPMFYLYFIVGLDHRVTRSRR